MDSFMKTLLVERSLVVSQESCTVVVDNARCHPQSWSKMPRRIRNSLMMKSDLRSSSMPQTRRKKDVRRTKSGSSSRGRPTRKSRPVTVDDPCSSRWKSISNTKQRQQPAAAVTQTSVVPAPPSCPQRQQSIEVTPQDWANVMKGGPSSVLESLQEEAGPRMPKRQTSEGLGQDVSSLPPPPMSLDTKLDTSRNSEPLLVTSSFSKVVKRSRASLLDDDDDDESTDDDATLHTVRSFRSI